jgi:hypothetical protein
MRIRRIRYLIGMVDKSRFPKKIRPKQKVGKMMWEFHLTDVDNWPSVPHGHSIDPPGYKLDVDHGIIYHILTRKIFGKVKEREMNALLSNPKFTEFLVKAWKIYENNQNKNVFQLYRVRRKSADGYTVLLHHDIIY